MDLTKLITDFHTGKCFCAKGKDKNFNEVYLTRLSNLLLVEVNNSIIDLNADFDIDRKSLIRLRDKLIENKVDILTLNFDKEV